MHQEHWEQHRAFLFQTPPNGHQAHEPHNDQGEKVVTIAGEEVTNQKQVDFIVEANEDDSSLN